MPWFENRRGERLWYTEQGTGYPVVLLHGWCMSSAVWKYQFDGLAASMRLIAVDLRGHGHSVDAEGYFDFNGFVTDLADLFDQLMLDGAVLLGWSMGGEVALQSCAELSNRLSGLALVCATPRFIASDDFPFAVSGDEAVGMASKVRRNIRRARDGFYTNLFARGEIDNHPAKAEIRQLLSEIPLPENSVALATLGALVGADMRGQLGNIRIPTLIMNGALDRICLPQASTYLKEHIHDAEQLVFPDSGHMPFLTRSGEFNAGIDRFVRRIREHNA